MKNYPKFYCPRCNDWVDHLHNFYDNAKIEPNAEKKIVENIVCRDCGTWTVRVFEGFENCSQTEVTVKKFTGEVEYSDCNELCVVRKLTRVVVVFRDNDAPIFKERQCLTIKSQKHFPITVTRYTNKWGKLVTSKVRGRYYLRSEDVEIKEGYHEI